MEFKRRTSIDWFADAGNSEEDLARWLDSNESAQATVTNYILEYGLDDLGEGWNW